MARKAAAPKRTAVTNSSTLTSMPPISEQAIRDLSQVFKLLSDETRGRLRALNDIAAARGQTLAQMALAWTLRDPVVTSTLVGASSIAQLEENVAALDRLGFSDDERVEIDRHAADSGVNIWAASSSH